MSDIGLAAPRPAPSSTGRPASRLTRLVANPRFQAVAARIPILSRLVASEGTAMFDLVAGFCHSQILSAVVQLHIPTRLLEQEQTLPELAALCDVPLDRMTVLIRGARALRLLKIRRSGHVALTTRGAALAGVPGLAGMICHHDVLYRDLSDPVAFFRGDTDTELAAFWPYVFGAAAAANPDVAATYSQLMADSQALVAADTIAAVNWRGATRVLDVGGGTGAFLTALGRAQTALDMTLFDLPAVAPAARDRFDAAGLTGRTRIVTGSFRDAPLPRDADIITLIRVLYDHADSTVSDLLGAAYAALPVGGRIVVSEPMSGGENPHPAGDAYFALYCMAMRTGRVRAPAEIAAALASAGFSQVRIHASKRPFVTTVISAVKPN